MRNFVWQFLFVTSSNNASHRTLSQNVRLGTATGVILEKCIIVLHSIIVCVRRPWKKISAAYYVWEKWILLSFLLLHNNKFYTRLDSTIWGVRKELKLTDATYSDTPETMYNGSVSACLIFWHRRRGITADSPTVPHLAKIEYTTETATLPGKSFSFPIVINLSIPTREACQG